MMRMLLQQSIHAAATGNNSYVRIVSDENKIKIGLPYVLLEKAKRLTEQY